MATLRRGGTDLAEPHFDGALVKVLVAVLAPCNLFTEVSPAAKLHDAREQKRQVSIEWGGGALRLDAVGASMLTLSL